MKALPRVGYSFCVGLLLVERVETRGKYGRIGYVTYDLGDGVDGLLALLVVGLEPEDESCKGLTSERLHS